MDMAIWLSIICSLCYAEGDGSIGLLCSLCYAEGDGSIGLLCSLCCKLKEMDL